MEEPQLKYSIGWFLGSFLIGIAAVADLLQVFLTLTVVFAIASDIVTAFVEGLILLCIFLRVGLRVIRGKKNVQRILSLLGETVIEGVPILNALPTLTIGTWYQIHTFRAEDKEKYLEAHARWESEVRQSRDEDEQLSQWAYYEAYAPEEGLEDDLEEGLDDGQVEELEDA